MNIKKFLFLIIMMSFTIVGCRPEQAATEYNITEASIEDRVSDDPNNQGDPDNESQGDKKSLDDYIAECDTAEQNNAMLDHTYLVSFPQAIECNFNEQGMTAADLNAEGNGPRIDGWIMARKEQYFPIDFPKNATLCDTDFNFPEQNMKYDDEIFLTMNDNILIASQDYSVANGDPRYANALLINELGLMQYKWQGPNGMYNVKYEQKGKYCLGLKPGDNNYNNKCNIPPTDTLGRMKLDLPSNEAVKLNMKNNSSQIKFGFITVGDNDNGDCEHSAYNFEVTVKYILNQ